MKRIITIIMALSLAVSIYAQELNVKGIVSSATDGEVLIGVTVKVKGKQIGTVTDIDGEYKIKANKGDVLEFSYVGFQSKSLKVSGEELNVTMSEDEDSLDELVVVGYGQVKKITLTGAASAIKGEDIRRVPTSSLQNTLQGKLPGFFSQQSSGQPGKDASDFFIRGVSSLNSDGNKPLIIVDDVEYSYEQLSQINVNEIESVTILKDAATTAIYGIKGANGVLVVKTRRGVEGAPQVTVRLEAGVQMPVRTPKFLNSANTAILVNEAYANDGIAPQWSQYDVETFRNGSDPYGHPDVNWYDEVFKKSAWQENANISISGGTKRLTYFASIGYLNQDGLVKNFGSSNDDVNSSYFYRRFNFRTNLDFKITDNLSLRLDITSRFMNINEPRGINATGQIYDWSKMRPYSAPVVNPDGSTPYLYDTDQSPVITARLANEGYQRNRRNDNNALFGVDWGLDWITKGLSFSGRVAYASIDENTRAAYRSSYPSYHYDSETGEYNINPNHVYTNGSYTVTGWKGADKKNFNLQFFLNYNRTFNDMHNVTAMFLYNRQSDTNVYKAEVPANFQGYTLKVGYRFQDKYLFDFNGAYNGSDRFGKNNRYGFFPSVSVGYIMSEEPFFRNNVGEWFDLFKIRGSFGIVGSDVAPGNRYLYKQYFGTSYNTYFGERIQNGSQVSYYEGDLGTDNITWEKSRKWDAGIEFRLFNRLSATVDWFYDVRYDQLVSRSSTPLIMGVGLAPSNIARTRNTGFDGSVSYYQNFGEFSFNTSFVFSYAKNKILYMDEAQQSYPWLMQTGHSIGQPFGYHWIGYYTPEDIAALNAGLPTAPAVPNTDVPVQAGDLKYEDLNGDGVINDYDRKAIGKPNLPNTTLGWTVAGSWKGFSLSLLFQGSFNYSFALQGTAIEPFKSQFQPIHTYRWTQERYEAGEEILFPRLTSNPSTVNSPAAYMSDFWLVDAWYIRLKTIDLSYTFPKKILPKVFQDLKVYVNAYNLFTWTNYNKYQQDPEISTNIIDHRVRVSGESANAGYYSAKVQDDIDAQLTVTERTGMAEYIFPESEEFGTVIIGAGISATPISTAAVSITGPNSCEGYATGGNFCGLETPYKVYFVAEFNEDAVLTGTWKDDRLFPNAKFAEGELSGVYFTFDLKKSHDILYRIGISYVSVENARENLRAENRTWDFNGVRKAAEDKWNEALGKIEVKGTNPDRIRQFYSHLYHVLIHPNVCSDVNGEYMGADNKVHHTNAKQYTSFSNWDTYRTQIQLLSMLEPEVASDVVISHQKFAEQSGGSFPRWVMANIETGVMQGDPSSILVSNAWAFGARNYDPHKLLAIMRKGAEEPGAKSQDVETRPGLQQYLEKGYYDASIQLEYTSADFAIAQFALRACGDEFLSWRYFDVARSWKNLFNPETGWLQSRNADGSWKRMDEDWRESTYPNYFWMVPYNIAGLVEICGGKEEAEKRLDHLFRRLDAGYVDEWYASGNEPSFQIPWTYNWIGQPWKTQGVVNRIINEQYHNTIDGLPGNDDLGTMGGWYVLACMGLYPQIPGVGGFAVNTPIFTDIKIHLGNGNDINITGGSEKNIYISDLKINGKQHDSTWIDWKDLENGADLKFTTSSSPNKKWGTKILPPSYN